MEMEMNTDGDDVDGDASDDTSYSAHDEVTKNLMHHHHRYGSMGTE